jgi:hypothetical protein
MWLLLGVAAGIALGVGKLPYFAGAAGSLSDTALRVVGTAGLTLLHSAARHGAPRRVVEGFAALVAVLVPGATALLLVLAARSTLRLRSLLGLVLVALGAAAFFYLPAGSAAGVGLLALAAAGIAVAATGPLVAAPLAGLAALVGTAYLPQLVTGGTALTRVPVGRLHEAIFSTAGAPTWLRAVVLVVAALPFAWAAKLVAR